MKNVEDVHGRDDREPRRPEEQDGSLDPDRNVFFDPDRDSRRVWRHDGRPTPTRPTVPWPDSDSQAARRS